MCEPVRATCFIAQTVKELSGLAWLGLAWLGLAWLGLAWLGLAWLGSYDADSHDVTVLFFQ